MLDLFLPNLCYNTSGTTNSPGAIYLSGLITEENGQLCLSRSSTQASDLCYSASRTTSSPGAIYLSGLITEENDQLCLSRSSTQANHMACCYRIIFFKSLFAILHEYTQNTGRANNTDVYAASFTSNKVQRIQQIKWQKGARNLRRFMGPLTVEQVYLVKGTKPVQGVQVQHVQGTELYWSYGWKCIISWWI